MIMTIKIVSLNLWILLKKSELIGILWKRISLYNNVKRTANSIVLVAQRVN